MEFLKTRHQIIHGIRRWFDQQNFIETETPMLVSAPSPEAQFFPVKTDKGYLITSPEYQMKRLLVGGFDKIFQISRCFRDHEKSPQHNPEFTMIELYEAYSNYELMMNMIEELVISCVDLYSNDRKIVYQEKEIDFNGPWERVHMIEWLSEKLGYSVLDNSDKILKEADKMKINHFDLPGKAITEIFEEKYLKGVLNPVFVYGFPIDVSPLARRNNDNPMIADRFELFVNEKEIANAFSELNDPEDQFDRFNKQLELKSKGDDEASDMDEDYINALRFGMPPTAGAGLGIDRLVMLLTDSPSIREVILFPHMRNE